MSTYTTVETKMWEKPVKESAPQYTDEEINEKYRLGEERIVTETNREKIPNFVDALKKKDYMDTQPFYQRRERWDEERQSRLIESFIMNIPVPPLFLYERDYNQYEVMDGQQRIMALKSFYSGEFQLKGLEVWKELNGRTYSKLPAQIRQGLDRRSISYIVVLKESTQDEEDALFLRQTVFERLNTGGIKLEAQEIRNCLFQGPFNNLLLELSKLDAFRVAWLLPKYTADEYQPNAAIKKQTMYQKLGDAELVLRFFALRHVAHYTRGMQGFLDLYMSRARNFTEADVAQLRALFTKTIRLALDVYGDIVFKPYNKTENGWAESPHKAFYDSVMVGLSEYVEKSASVLAKKSEIIDATKDLFINSAEGTFTGRGNTKADIQERLKLYKDMLASIVS
jgi:Protein of unknown function DUF262